MSRPCLPIFALLAVALVGCRSGSACHDEHLVAEHWPGGAVKEGHAPFDAVYSLYRHTDGVERARVPGSPKPPTEVCLEQKVTGGESVGFRRDKDGQLLAVAGTQSVVIPEARYCWHLSPQTENADLKRAGAGAMSVLRTVAVTIVAVPVGAVGILMAPLLWGGAK
jgi:hypothetical protein